MRRTKKHNDDDEEADADGKYASRPVSQDRWPTFSVRMPIVVNTDEYEVFLDEYRVRTVIEERQHNDELYYVTKFEDGHVAEVSGWFPKVTLND